ncbi:hypothetical protein MBOU_25250 [Mycobacterium bourgelatii]|uniref:Uncharacterized protein n=1 Tax=Mycobacterium bourgelatii TaxID=1273442 RepID=A0A7I9YPT3_MYCBU|nr:hypothetical protein MBOU_25250 [Mycobacterium bourgelatii]
MNGALWRMITNPFAAPDNDSAPDCPGRTVIGSAERHDGDRNAGSTAMLAVNAPPFENSTVSWTSHGEVLNRSHTQHRLAAHRV